jgi:cytochrome P450
VTTDISALDPHIPPDLVISASKEMLGHCPVAHSDKDGGFWIVNRHADLLQVMQDAETFQSGNKGVKIPQEPIEKPYQPPIDSNGREHHQYRSIENPYVTPNALQAHEPVIRCIIGGLIDGFKDDGHVEIMDRLAKIVPAQLTLQVLFGVTDPQEQVRVREWIRSLSYDLYRKSAGELREVQANFTAWCYHVIERRRADHGTGTMLDGLIAGRVEGEPVSDLNIVGAMQILVFGGFLTTADATANILCRIINTPGAERRLRDHPDQIPAFVEETLRLDPPVTGRARRASRDVVLGGQLIRAGDRVLCNFLAANIDPEEWEDADEFIENRRRNRVMTFGAGPHRCIGSHMARLVLRVMVEEILARLKNIRYADPDERETRVSFNIAAWRTIDRLRIGFDRAGAA